MAKKKKCDVYILMTQDKEVVEFGPGSQLAAQQYATYHARQLGKAVFYAKVEGVASGEIAKLEEQIAGSLTANSKPLQNLSLHGTAYPGALLSNETRDWIPMWFPCATTSPSCSRPKLAPVGFVVDVSRAGASGCPAKSCTLIWMLFSAR